MIQGALELVFVVVTGLAFGWPAAAVVFFGLWVVKIAIKMGSR